MSKYEIRDASGHTVAEASFDTFDEANAWSTEQDIGPGWTMFQQMSGEWVAARHDPSAG
ncbi:MAG: hypothetical protein JWP31_2277 [Aeromicrobium sp.]|nr:hypothetical protein [Aeromicrobium sp.]